MYTEFYGLREKPFALTPDPRFLYLSASHREALAHVLYGIEQGEGFISVTGEVGTGKTTLCWTLLERLGPDTEVAFVFNPMLSGEELLRAICGEFGLASAGLSRAQINDELNRFLLEQRRAGRRVLLIIDEAQNLPPQTLEEIRLLSNLETSKSKLLQILLFGQPELDAKLESRELRQLRQRISVRWGLQALDAGETREYVRHRLRTASGGHGEMFSDGALREVHRRSGGIPRVVNLICDRALLAGYAAGQRQIGPEFVSGAAHEILGRKRRSRLAGFWPGARAVVAAAALVGLLVVGAVAWRRLGPHELEPTSAALPKTDPRPAAPAAAEAAPELPGTGAGAEQPPDALSAGAGGAG
jgi:general secretion pathway protein A